MKKAFWNYEEPVTFRVVIVRLLPVEKPPMHWQNTFAGEVRQCIEVTADIGGSKPYTFLIDNQDGLGMLKIGERGSPQVGHRSVDNHEFIEEWTDESKWNGWDPATHDYIEQQISEWGKKNCPEEHARAERLREAWANSKEKAMIDKGPKRR